jgi:FlaA1/EpsC-like NDP-sugar epimerase
VQWTGHAVLVAVAYLLAFYIDGEFFVARAQWTLFLGTLPLLLPIRLATFAWFHLFEGLWRYVSMRDIITILKAVSLSSLVFSITILMTFGKAFPRTVLLLDWLLCLALVGGVRLTIRAIRESGKSEPARGRRTMIVGAGDAGEMLIREIGRNPGLNFAIVGFVDDDRRKQGRRLHGIKVLGGIDQLPDLCRTRRVEELLIAIPSATGTEMRRIIGACRAAKVRFSTIPSLVELKEAPFTLSKVRRVKIEDLLRRDPVSIERAEVEHAAPLLWGQV